MGSAIQHIQPSVNAPAESLVKGYPVPSPFPFGSINTIPAIETPYERNDIEYHQCNDQNENHLHCFSSFLLSIVVVINGHSKT